VDNYYVSSDWCQSTITAYYTTFYSSFRNLKFVCVCTYVSADSLMNPPLPTSCICLSCTLACRITHDERHSSTNLVAGRTGCRRWCSRHRAESAWRPSRRWSKTIRWWPSDECTPCSDRRLHLATSTHAHIHPHGADSGLTNATASCRKNGPCDNGQVSMRQMTSNAPRRRQLSTDQAGRRSAAASLGWRYCSVADDTWLVNQGSHSNLRIKLQDFFRTFQDLRYQ